MKSEDFIKKCIIIHDDKYDYSKTEYKHSHSKVNIICPKHGYFMLKSSLHISGVGCPLCLRELFNKNMLEYIISEGNKIHNYKYDYSIVKYIKSNKKIDIICPIHGVFSQTHNSHLQGCGCPKCALTDVSAKNSKKDYIIDFIKIHGDKYDYSKVLYVNARYKIIIICPIHGQFKQTPDNHLKGCGCPKCSTHKVHISQIKTNYLEDFIKIHKNEYDYSKVKYIGAHKKIEIICKIHGSFLQTPRSHTNGNGCPRCKNSKGNNRIMNYLKNNKIKFIDEFKFDDCKNKFKLPFDFYLPDYNMCIEFDGKQHYISNKYFGEDSFQKLKINDEIKNNYCLSNNIRLIRIPYYEYNNIETIINLEINI